MAVVLDLETFNTDIDRIRDDGIRIPQDGGARHRYITFGEAYNYARDNDWPVMVKTSTGSWYFKGRGLDYGYLRGLAVRHVEINHKPRSKTYVIQFG